MCMLELCRHRKGPQKWTCLSQNFLQTPPANFSCPYAHLCVLYLAFFLLLDINCIFEHNIIPHLLYIFVSDCLIFFGPYRSHSADTESIYIFALTPIPYLVITGNIFITPTYYAELSIVYTVDPFISIPVHQGIAHFELLSYTSSQFWKNHQYIFGIVRGNNSI